MLESSALPRHETLTTLNHPPEVDLIRTTVANTTQFRGVLNVKGQFLEVNPLSLEFLGMSRGAVVGEFIWEGFWWHTDEAREEVFQLVAVAQQGETSSSELEITGKEHRLWIEFLLKPVRDQKGDIVMILVEGNDITARKRLEQQLRDSERQHRMVVEAMSEGVLQLEADGRISLCNAAARTMLGLTTEQLIGRSFFHLGWQAIHENGSFFSSETHPAVVTLHTGKAQTNVVMGVRKPEGQVTWTLINSEPIFAPDPQLLDSVVVTFTDITARKELEDKLRQAALYDALTGLATRTLLMERLTQVTSRAHRDSRAKFAVLFLDLDNFKTVNDTFGHAAGDGLLRSVAQTLQSCVREADTVARLGGDEFVILLEGVSSREAAVSFAKRVLGRLNLEQGLGGESVRASIGVALGDTHSDPATLLKGADTAMYKAKGKGGGQVKVNGCSDFS
jgi:diguanylate cyclase (GGDEF)-like protein/PAS domain S-box-containing protein